jgi:hypothetical protein
VGDRVSPGLLSHGHDNDDTIQVPVPLRHIRPRHVAFASPGPAPTSPLPSLSPPWSLAHTASLVLPDLYILLLATADHTPTLLRTMATNPDSRPLPDGWVQQ